MCGTLKGIRLKENQHCIHFQKRTQIETAAGKCARAVTVWVERQARS